MPQVMADFSAPIHQAQMTGGGKTPSVYQSAIYDFHKSGSGHGMVDAVAGSGKTTTLVECANQLNFRDIYGSAFCAFNKHIATELGSRLPSGMTVRTIHAYGLQSLRNRYQPEHSEWVDGNKYKKLARLYWKQRGLDPWRDQNLVTSLCDVLRMSMLTLTPLTGPDAVEILCDAYDITLSQGMTYGMLQDAALTLMEWGIHGTEDGQYRGAAETIDFNDMIFLPVHLGLPMTQYERLYVDEAQDLSACQRELLFKMARPDARMLFVGDPYQSIYAFAGADSSSYQRIRERLGGADLPLSICYRCPSSHLNLAREIVPHIEARPGAPAGIIANADYHNLHTILEAGDMIISRTTAPLVTLCFELLAMGVPAKVRGRDIGESLLRIADSVSKTQGFRFAWLGQSLEDYHEIQMLRLRAKPDTEMQIQSLNDRVDTLLALWSRAISQNITEMEGFRYFVERLFSDEYAVITLCTVHRAKGLENERIFLLNPHLMPFPKATRPQDVSQEMNLKYVALTRAKSDLYFIQGNY